MAAGRFSACLRFSLQLPQVMLDNKALLKLMDCKLLRQHPTREAKVVNKVYR